MLEAKSLVMRYGRFTALDQISFQANPKEILGLLGPNGAGKTTTMRILTTFLYPTSGTAYVEGLDILEQPLEIRRLIGYLPETAPLYPEMQVEEYLEFVGRARDLSGNTLQKRLNWVKDACALGEVWKQTIGELSKGYRQRTGLAQALIHDPKVLILDEPTAGLDPLQVMSIRKLLKELAAEKTLIFSTHVLQEVEAVADRMVILNEGKLVASGTPGELEARVRREEKIEKNKPLTLEEIFVLLMKSASSRETGRSSA